MIRVATANIPHRLGPHRADLTRLAVQGAAIIVAQEETDKDNSAPLGWKRFRPRRARSVSIYWDPRQVTLTRRGARRLSSPGFYSLRYGVWGHFRTPDGPLRVMGVHLPAFYSRNARNRREYGGQAQKVARWARGGRNRVVAGDYNGSVGGARMRPLERVLEFSEPVRSGPGGTKIDYVAANKEGRWTIKRTRLGEKGRSDHRPVLVDLVRRTD